MLQLTMLSYTGEVLLLFNIVGLTDSSLFAIQKIVIQEFLRQYLKKSIMVTRFMTIWNPRKNIPPLSWESFCIGLMNPYEIQLNLFNWVRQDIAQAVNQDP